MSSSRLIDRVRVAQARNQPMPTRGMGGATDLVEFERVKKELHGELLGSLDFEQVGRMGRDELAGRLRDEVQAHRNASIVVGGSQTADKGSDMFSELVPEEGISVARALVTPYGRTNFLDKMLKRGVTEQVGIDAREKAERMITSSADKDEVLKQIAKELRAQRSARTVRDRVSGPLGAEVAYGFFRRPPQDNEK